MLVRKCRCLALASALACGCAIDLDARNEPTVREAGPPPLESCALLEGQVEDLRGPVTTVSLPDSSELVVTAQATIDGSRLATAFADVHGDCGESARALAARPVIDTSLLGTDVVVSPRSGFSSDAAYLYFSVTDDSGFASKGTGIARFDEDSSKFVAQALLWTGDRPSYGASAVLDGDFVYVYGGLAARFLAADVYLARAPLGLVAEPNAYEYFSGGGEWATDPDLANPLLEGGVSPSVRWDAAHERYVMVYTAPLAREIRVRSGLGPGGPWSLPVLLGVCTLPFPTAFCESVSQLPSFAREGELALAQGIATFEPPADATAEDYWTQLLRAPWPQNLP